jgi:hypothetical protein
VFFWHVTNQPLLAWRRLKANVPLDAGNNELLVGVANDFYGWGIVARLDSLAGVAVEGPSVR